MRVPDLIPRLVKGLAALIAAAVLLAGQAGAAQDSGDLQGVMESYRKELRTAHQNLDRLEEQLETDNVTLRDRLYFLNKKRDQLVLISGSATTPWDFRDVLQGTDWLRREVKDLLSHPAATDLSLKNSLKQLNEIEARIAGRLQEQVYPETEADLRTFLDEIDDLMKHIQASRAKLGQVLAPAKDMKHSLDAWEDGINGELKQAWLPYYSESLPTLLYPHLADQFVSETNQWGNWSAMIAGIAFGEDLPGGWPEAMARSLGLALALGLAVWAGLRRYALKNAGARARAQLFRAMGCWSLALGIFFLADHLSYVVYSQALALEEMAFSAGLVFFSWFLTLLGGPADTPKTALRWPLWLVFSLGLILECCRVPGILTQVLLAGALLSLGLIIKRQVAKTEARLDRVLAVCCGVLLPLLAGLSLCGYYRVAIVCTTVLFYLILAVRFSTALARLSVVWQAKAEEHGSPVLRGLLSGIGLPLIFLCVLSLSLWLALSPLEGQYAFLDFMSLEVKFEGLAFSAKRLGMILFGYYLFRSAVDVTESVLMIYARHHRELEGGVVHSLRTIARYVWWGLFALYAMVLLGFSFTSLAVVAGGLSVGIGFGLQQIVNNFISGLILLFGRSVEVGDVLQIGDLVGVVRKVNIRNTMVQTYDNATIFVPNSNLVSNQIINWSHRDRRVRRDMNVGVAYGSDREKVRRLLIEAALSVPEILREPAPDVLFTDFGPSSLNFTLRAWVPEVGNASTVLSNVRDAVDTMLRQNSVEIAFPQTDVHVRTAPGLADLAQSLIKTVARDGAAGD